METNEEKFVSSYLIAADGRNSTVARMAGVSPPVVKDRIGLQTHLPLNLFRRNSNTVTLQLLKKGYCGVAPVDPDTINLCLVSRPSDSNSLRRWAHEKFNIPEEQEWRSIAPLSRAAIPPQRRTLLLTGDAARVVEPFTGEGIFYAIASGELAANAVIDRRLDRYPAEHDRLYSGRLWVNRLTKFIVTHPELGSAALEILRRCPGPMPWLINQIVRDRNS